MTLFQKTCFWEKICYFNGVTLGVSDWACELLSFQYTLPVSIIRRYMPLVTSLLIYLAVHMLSEYLLSIFFFYLFSFALFSDRVSLCSPDWPGIQGPPALASGTLGYRHAPLWKLLEFGS
jgi:hypothetical protein